MTENKKPIKVALLGAGYISSWHAEAIRRAHGVELTAVCDTSRGAAQSLADKYRIPNTFASLDELLDAKVADSVHVLTPPTSHFDAANKIIDAGLAAFVEKPFALSSSECRQLDELAQERKVALGVNHNFLMLPSYDRLKSDIADKIIGPIDSFEANWQFPLPPMRSGPFNLWMLRSTENILFEIGPHLFAFVADILGVLEDVEVSLRNPVLLPSGVTHYQSWRITGTASNASVVLNLSLIEGHDNRSVNIRGVGALARYDFAENTYRREQASMQDIVAAPFLRQLSVAGQALRSGASNAVQQIVSLNGLAPYGLSIQRAVDSFYSSLARSAPVDKRLSASLGASVSAMIETAVEQAKPKFESQAAIPPIQNSPFKEKSVLVIGGTGFIGRALSHKLADSGYDVKVFSRGAAEGFERPDGRISVFTGSLKSDEDLRRAMASVDCVFHLAKATETSWEGYLENDVGVTRRIGEACIDSGVARFVYTGTIDSYDASQPGRTISELTPFDHDLTRRNLYARSKAACEDVLKNLQRDRGLPLVIVRPGIVIGPGGPLQHWGIAMWRSATACKLWGSGENIMPFVLVDDTAQGLVLAMESNEAIGKSFNLVGDPMLSARQYFEEVARANNVRIRAVPTPVWTYYFVDVVKYWMKRVLAKRTGITKPSYRDWKSRAQLSPYANQNAKSVLGWEPEADKKDFIERGIASANLIGVTGNVAERDN